MSVVLSPKAFGLNVQIDPVLAFIQVFRQMSQYSPFEPPPEALVNLRSLEGNLKHLIMEVLSQIMQSDIDGEMLQGIKNVLQLGYFTKLEGATVYASCTRKARVSSAKIHEIFELDEIEHKILTAMMKPDFILIDGKVCHIYSFCKEDKYYFKYAKGTLVLKDIIDTEITCIQEMPYAMSIENCRNVRFSCFIEGGFLLIIKDSTSIDLSQLRSFPEIVILNSKHINLDSLISNRSLEMFQSTDVSAKELRSIEHNLEIAGCDSIDLPNVETCGRLALTMPASRSINIPRLQSLNFPPR